MSSYEFQERLPAFPSLRQQGASLGDLGFGGFGGFGHLREAFPRQCFRLHALAGVVVYFFTFSIVYVAPLETMHLY